MSVLYALRGCWNLRLEALRAGKMTSETHCCHNTFQMTCFLSMDDLCRSVCLQIIVWWCQPSGHHTVHPSLLFVPFLWSPASASHPIPSYAPPLFPLLPVCFSVSLFSSFSPAVFLAIFLGRWTGGFDPSDAAHFPLCLPLRVYSWLSSL